MIKKVFRVVFTLCGMLLGYGVSNLVTERAFPAMDISLAPIYAWIIAAVIVILFGIIFFYLFKTLVKRGEDAVNAVGESLSKVPATDLVSGLVGLMIGLMVAFLISQTIRGIKVLQTMYLDIIISVLLYFFFGFAGVTLCTKLGKEIGRLAFPQQMGQPQSQQSKQSKSSKHKGSKPKVLDTSVIIDGRIIDILKTGFIEGDIIIPDFVLVELRHISDSADDLKRAKGRRGLDILNRIREDFGIEVYDTASDKSLQAEPEVDVKLIKLAQSIKGCVVTNDFNLNKVASVQGVKVLNINELANTLKPVVIPGEAMQVFLVKEGKEAGQAVAYLDDGTMIVIENGKSEIGNTVNITVTSVLQTSAGRMIFGRI